MSTETEPRYYSEDSRNACTSALWSVKDRRGRSMDGAPITVASGLMPDEAAQLARDFNTGADRPVTAGQAAELAWHGRARDVRTARHADYVLAELARDRARELGRRDARAAAPKRPTLAAACPDDRTPLGVAEAVGVSGSIDPDPFAEAWEQGVADVMGS